MNDKKNKHHDIQEPEEIVKEDSDYIDSDFDFESLQNKKSDHKLAKFKEDLEKCKAEKEEYLLGWQRSKADYINLKRRNDEEVANLKDLVSTSILSDFLSILDVFEMAFKDKEAWNQAPQNWRVGVEHIYNQFKSVFENYGIVGINPFNQTFDPNLHEATENVPTDDPAQDHKILEVVLKGYKMRDKILRPAKVKVGQLEQK